MCVSEGVCNVNNHRRVINSEGSGEGHEKSWRGRDGVEFMKYSTHVRKF